MYKHQDILQYNEGQLPADKEICYLLSEIIAEHLPEAENKIWHAHPVWFLDGNPIVGYSKQKNGIRLMFWSGADFEEPSLLVGTGKFRDASVFFNSTDEIKKEALLRYLEKSRKIQWDYKNIVKRKGQLVRLTDF